MQECWFGTTQFIMEKDSFQLKCCNNHCMLPKLGICPCDRNIVINKSILLLIAVIYQVAITWSIVEDTLHIISDGHNTLQKGNIIPIS